MKLYGEGSLTIVCAGCDRNLATVTNPGDWNMTRDGLVVLPRNDVDQEEYRHGIRDVTYTWTCRCGQVWSRRHSWVGAMWAGMGMETTPPRARRKVRTDVAASTGIGRE